MGRRTDRREEVHGGEWRVMSANLTCQAFYQPPFQNRLARQITNLEKSRATPPSDKGLGQTVKEVGNRNANRTHNMRWRMSAGRRSDEANSGQGLQASSDEGRT